MNQCVFPEKRIRTREYVDAYFDWAESRNLTHCFILFPRCRSRFFKLWPFRTVTMLHSEDDAIVRVHACAVENTVNASVVRPTRRMRCNCVIDIACNPASGHVRSRVSHIYNMSGLTRVSPSSATNNRYLSYKTRVSRPRWTADLWRTICGGRM